MSTRVVVPDSACRYYRAPRRAPAHAQPRGTASPPAAKLIAAQRRRRRRRRRRLGLEFAPDDGPRAELIPHPPQKRPAAGLPQRAGINGQQARLHAPYRNPGQVAPRQGVGRAISPGVVVARSLAAAGALLGPPWASGPRGPGPEPCFRAFGSATDPPPRPARPASPAQAVVKVMRARAAVAITRHHCRRPELRRRRR